MSDAAHRNPTRRFPSYTTAQLRESLSQYDAGTHPLQAYTEAEHIEAIRAEVANRESGISKAFHAPQHNGPIVIRRPTIIR